MAHRIQDARPQQPVPARLSQGQRLDEIPLRQPAARCAVVTHPRRQQRRLRHRRKQGAANRLGKTTPEQPVPVTAEVLNQRLASMLAICTCVRPFFSKTAMTYPRSRFAHASRTSWRAQTRSTILRTSEIARTTARFPFPWSLASR